VDMETRDFNNDYLIARVIDIVSYDKLLLEIDYPTKKEQKICTLFKVPTSNQSNIFIEDVGKHLRTIVETNNFYKIKILNERRQRGASCNNILVMLYSLDIKTNINDKLLRYIAGYKSHIKLDTIISNIRALKL
jgi:hypothetical protein